MYGMLFKVLQSCIIERYGEEMWVDVAIEAGIDFARIEEERRYSHLLFFELLRCASRRSGVSVGELMEGVGAYWLPFVLHSCCGESFCTAGLSAAELFRNLDCLRKCLSIDKESRGCEVGVRSEVLGNGMICLRFTNVHPLLAPFVRGLTRRLSEWYEAPYEAVFDDISSAGYVSN